MAEPLEALPLARRLRKQGELRVPNSTIQPGGPPQEQSATGGPRPRDQPTPESRARHTPGVGHSPAGASFTGWSRIYDEARAALLRRLATTPELSPRALADTVAAAVPARVGRWLLAHLEQLRWLTPDARIPFDILDGPACPPSLLPRGHDRRRGLRHHAPRELVHLAVFGLPGQGLASRDKHRQDVFQQICAEIMHDAVDTDSLEHVVNRVLNHPDLAADPMLASMVRGFIAERKAALHNARTTPAEEQARVEHTSKLQHAFGGAPGAQFPTRAALLSAFAQLHRDFDAYVSQFEEVRAQQTLCKMRELRQRFPVHIPAADLQRCEERLDRLLRRTGTYQRQLEELAVCGSRAARTGDQKKAAWILRRLEAVHTLLPHLLPGSRLEELRSVITRSGTEHDANEATRELLARQRLVANHIRNLAGIIHRYHELAHQVPRDEQAYAAAEANYRHAVQEIRALDTDWLAGLIVKLETILDDLDDPAPMQTQLDQFIANVRTALNRLRAEIRTIQAGQSAPGKAPQAGAPPPMPPPDPASRPPPPAA